MALSNSKKLEILRKAKNGGYRGNYLDLFKRYEEGGLPTINVPEVEISALKDETYDKLSQAQKKLYDLYQTPQGTRQTIPITVGRDRKVTQDIHYLDALNLAARNPLTQIRNKPFSNVLVDLVQGKPEVNRHGQFRAHYVPATKDIYMSPHDANIKDITDINKYVVVDWDDNPTDMNLGDPQDLKKFHSNGELYSFSPDFSSQREYLESDPARKAQMIKNANRKPFPKQLEKAASKSLEKAFQEYGHADSDTNHPMQNFFGQVITYGDRARRAIKEGSWPDASNYNSKFDYEYHTHHSPNSAVNQLVDRYGMDQYDMVNKKPTIGQYNFTIPTGEITGAKLRPDYDPGITKFEHGGPHADIPPYESLTDFQKEHITSNNYEQFSDRLNYFNNEIVPGSGGTLDSLAMHNLFKFTQSQMQPHKHVYRQSSFAQNADDLLEELEEIQKNNPNSKYKIQNDYSVNYPSPTHTTRYFIAETERDGKELMKRGRNEDEMKEELDLLKSGYKGIMPHTWDLEKLYGYKNLMQSRNLYERDDQELADAINTNISLREKAEREGRGNQYILGETPTNFMYKENFEAQHTPDNTIMINNDGPLYSKGVGIPIYEEPVGRSTRPPEIQLMPTIPARPIPTNTEKIEMQKATPLDLPDRGPSKADIFHENLNKAQVYYNRPDEFTRGRKQGDPTVSTQYIFSPDNPYVPKDGQYFMSEPNTRGKRKYDGDLNAARKWEREQGLGTQTDLRGYNVGNSFSHGGFSRFFNKDYSKYTKGTK